MTKLTGLLRTLATTLRAPRTPAIEPYETFRQRLMAEGRRDFGPLDSALDRVYRDRPTAYTRKLRAAK